MAGPTIGRAEIQVDFDGDQLGAQSAAIGKQAGQGAGSAYTKSFQAQLSKSAKQLADRWARDGTFNGRIYGKNLGTAMGDSLMKNLKRVRTQIADAFTSKDGFTAFVKNVGGTREALLQLEEVLQREHALGEISQKQYKALGLQANTWAKALDRADAELINLNFDKAKAIQANKQLAASEKLAAEVLRDHDRALQMVANSASREKIAAATEGMTEQNTRLGNSMRDLNAALGNKRSFDAYVRNAGGADAATSRLTDTMEDLRRNGKLTTFQTQLLQEKMGDLGNRVERTTKSMDRHVRSTKKAGEAHQSLWKGLSANTRQWTLIIAAIAAAGQEIGVLGSAAGSGLAVLGTSLLAVGAAAIVGIAGFKGMGGELSGIEEAARPAAIALREMGTVMGDLQNVIQSALFQDLAGPFNELTAQLPRLAGSLSTVATAVGGFLGALASGLGSENGITKLDALLTGFGPVIDGLGGAVIKLGSALGTIFIASLPATQMFSGWLDTLMGQFSTFLSSAEGQTALATFFDHLITVMPALGALIGATGRMLAGLVTEDSVARLVQFLGSLETFMPMLGTLLGILGELNVFGLLAAGLVMIGEALAPLAGPLFEVAGILRDALLAGMTALVGPIQTVAAAFAPLLPLVATLVTQLGAALLPILTPLASLFAAIAVPLFVLIETFAQLAIAVLGSLTPGLTAITDIFISMLPSLLPLTAAIMAMLPSVMSLGEAIMGLLIQAFAALAPLIEPLIGIIIALMPTVMQLAEILVGLLGTALTIIVPLLAPLLDLLAMIAGMLPSLMPLITLLADVIGQVLAIAVGVILALLPSLISLFQLVWSVVEPLIPIVVALISAALIPLQLAFSILIPIIKFVVEVLALVITAVVNATSPFLNLIAPLTDAGGAIDGFGGIINSAKSTIKSWGDSVTSVLDGVMGAIKNVIGWFSDLFGASDKAKNVQAPSAGGGAPATATGGLFTRAQTRLIGEDGPEAVVPLDRPLSKVDPAVRNLSRIAQGLGGGDSGGASAGRQVTVAAGAIVIQTAANPFLTATATLDRLVAVI